MSDKAIHTSDVKTIVKNNIRNYSMFILLFLIMIFFAPFTSGNNWSPRNFTNLFFQNSHILILAVGMVMVIIVRGIDLSVGSVCAFVGALSAMFYNLCLGVPALQPFALILTILASILMGAAIGAFQGAWVAYAKLPAFIVTLAGMMLFRGLTYMVTSLKPVRPADFAYSFLNKGTLDEFIHVLFCSSCREGLLLKGINGIDSTHLFKIGPYYPMAIIFAIALLVLFFIAEFKSRKKNIKNEFEVVPMSMFITKLALISVLALGIAERFARERGLPVVVLILGIIVFIFHFITKNTIFGRYIYAVGGNPRSATLSGINSDFVTFLVFSIMGALVGVASVIYTGYMNSAEASAGNLFELDTIAACYIGGVSAGGGIGTVIGVIVGGFVMAAINNGMSLMNLSINLQYVVKALILLLAVFYDVYNRRKSGLG